MNVVYFIQVGGSGPIKIGTATDLAQRIATLQTGSPDPFVLLGSIPGDARTEGALHRALAHHRHRGEWFKPTPEVLEAIQNALKGILPRDGGHREIVRRVGSRVIAETLGLSIHTVNAWAGRGRVPGEFWHDFAQHGWASLEELASTLAAAVRKVRAA